MNQWRYIQNKGAEAKGYFLWQHADGYYNVTKEKVSPTQFCGGYWNLNELMKLKGI